MLKINKDMHVVAGNRKCIFLRIEEEFLLTVFEDTEDADSCDSILYSLNEPAAVLWYVLKDCPIIEKVIKELHTYYPGLEHLDISENALLFLESLQKLKFVDFVEEKALKNKQSPFMLPPSDDGKGLFDALGGYSKFEIKPELFTKQEAHLEDCFPSGPTDCFQCPVSGS